MTHYNRDAFKFRSKDVVIGALGIPLVACCALLAANFITTLSGV